VKIESASEYTGTHVSVTIVNYYFSCAVFTLLMFPLCSENLWEYIAYFISANYGWILSTMLPVALNIAAKKFFVGKVLLDEKNKTIRNRTLWSFWELYNLFIGLLAGLAKGVGRFFVTVAFAFMAVARVDKLSLPTWLNALVPVDAVHQVYNAMFYMHHSHNAPAFRVAAWLFQECGDTHRSRVETKGESGLLTPAGARARGLKSRCYYTPAPSCVTTESTLSARESREGKMIQTILMSRRSHQRVARRRRILRR